jgi:hypothetical protein
MQPHQRYDEIPDTTERATTIFGTAQVASTATTRT